MGIVLGIAYFTIGLKFNDTLLTLGSSEDELPCEDDIYDALSKEEQINAYGNTYRILEWGNFTNREEAFNYFENKWDINILGFTSEIPVNINYLILIKTETPEGQITMAPLTFGYCDGEDFVWEKSVLAY